MTNLHSGQVDQASNSPRHEQGPARRGLRATWRLPAACNVEAKTPAERQLNGIWRGCLGPSAVPQLCKEGERRRVAGRRAGV